MGNAQMQLWKLVCQIREKVPAVLCALLGCGQMFQGAALVF